MLQAAIVLWLLASICSLEVADAVKRDVNTQSNAFDPEQTKIAVQKKVGDLIAEGMTDYRDAQVLLSIMNKNTSLVFQTKLMQELDDVRVSKICSTSKCRHF
uniref:Venom protein n=1 Tax=Ampulex compressa TaxID=860918 RepID=A0A1W6EVS8_AMPCP|nr:venom protein [Ampulex compressa]